MSEGVPLPDFSQANQPESQPQQNAYYQAVAENQRMWREAKRGLMRPYEMRHVAENVEAKMKHIFSNYIDPSFPRVLIAASLVLDNPTEAVPYHMLDVRYPETIREEDQENYVTGMYHLNEWATNYATMHYLKTVSSNPITTLLRKAYAWYGDALSGRFMGRQAYQAMDEVRKTAKTTGTDLDHAVFQGLFQHDFSQLDALITQTDTLQAASVDELAVAVGKHSAKVFDPTATHFRHFAPRSTDSPFMKALRNTADSLLSGGQFAIPGVVEVVFTAPIALSVVGALEGATTHNLSSVLATAGIVGGLGASDHPFVLIHETIHGYSASSDYVGFRPKQLAQEASKE